MLRPQARLPLWAAAAIPAVAYGVRSVARGSVRPDVPSDLIVFGVLALALLVAAVRSASSERGNGNPDHHLGGDHDCERHGGQDHQV